MVSWLADRRPLVTRRPLPPQCLALHRCSLLHRQVDDLVPASPPGTLWVSTRTARTWQGQGLAVDLTGHHVELPVICGTPNAEATAPAVAVAYCPAPVGCTPAKATLPQRLPRALEPTRVVGCPAVPLLHCHHHRSRQRLPHSRHRLAHSQFPSMQHHRLVLPASVCPCHHHPSLGHRHGYRKLNCPRRCLAWGNDPVRRAARLQTHSPKHQAQTVPRG